jgi:amphi-Trp domain-containing protein
MGGRGEVEERRRAMGNPSKEKVRVARTEAVQRLQTLAKQLETGTIRLGGQTFQVPEHVGLEMKADRDEFDIELKWKAPAIEEPIEAVKRT